MTNKMLKDCLKMEVLSSNKYLLNAYYMLGTVLSTGHTSEQKTKITVLFLKLRGNCSP